MPVDINSVTFLVAVATLIIATAMPAIQLYFSYLYRKQGQDLSELINALLNNPALLHQYYDLKELYEVRYMIATHKREKQNLLWLHGKALMNVSFKALAGVIVSFIVIIFICINESVLHDQTIRSILCFISFLTFSFTTFHVIQTCWLPKVWQKINQPQYLNEVSLPTTNGFMPTYQIKTPYLDIPYAYIGIPNGTSIDIYSVQNNEQPYMYKHKQFRPMTLAEIEWCKSLNALGFKRKKNNIHNNEKAFDYYIPYHIQSDEHSFHTDHYMVLDSAKL